MLISHSPLSIDEQLSVDIPALAPVAPRKTLGDQAYESVREALASGELLPGQRLTVRALASLLNIGFTPAREALNRLTTEAYIERGSNRGLRVPFLSEKSYRELVTIRLELEPLAAVSALPHIDSHDIEQLENVQAALLDARESRDYRLVLARNREFHFFIYGRCNMPTLLAILESLWLRTGPMLRLLHPASTSDWKGGINHAAIIDALRSGDQKILVQAIRQDLIDGSEQLCAELRRKHPEVAKGG